MDVMRVWPEKEPQFKQVAFQSEGDRMMLGVRFKGDGATAVVSLQLLLLLKPCLQTCGETSVLKHLLIYYSIFKTIKTRVLMILKVHTHFGIL